MIVRTYGRRSRCGGGAASFSDSGDPDLPFSQEALADGDGDDELFLLSSQEAPRPAPAPPLMHFSSQDSSPWDFDDDLAPNPALPPAKKRQRRRGRGGGAGGEVAAAATATLMEAEEYGEMMESVDEVNFALDGLRGGPRRVRRASLLALLGICGTAARRRLLRAQGLAQQIIDAILALNIDDTPCTIAAAALFFVLASDVQDDHLLDSESCVNFLLKLLNPPVNAIEGKAPSIGSKLLGISKVQMLNGSNKDVDSRSEEIISKVEEILLNCKEIKSADRDDKSTRPELCSKWIALLTMEKACLSCVSFEETCDTVRRVGGNFKERLRELGGLDAIFDVMATCHSTLEEFVKDSSRPILDLKEGPVLQSVTLLLKCLKIMENATFLSKNNQIHLLKLNRKLRPRVSPLSFVGLVISAIELLSALSLLQSSSSGSTNRDPKPSEVSTGNCIDIKDKTLLDGHPGCKNAKMEFFSLNQKRRNCASSKSEMSYSDLEIISSGSDVCPSQKTPDCSQSILSNGASSGSFGKRHMNGGTLKLNIRKDRGKANSNRSPSGRISLKVHSFEGSSRDMAKRRRISENGNSDLSTGGDDPFAFDEDELEPSKWELLSSQKDEPQGHRSNGGNGAIFDDCELPVVVENNTSSQSIHEENHPSGEISHLFQVEEESSLLEDCLLTSVKVLMNLTNDNPVGCEQIASFGGLNTMALLITKHFPSFDFSLHKDNQIKENLSSGHGICLSQDPLSSQDSKTSQVNSKQLRDHELDFLVAILGLLVNLVEKDNLNRVRLASARVSVDQYGNPESEEIQRDVIPLLCSIFLANQGAGEAAGVISPDDEESLLQGAREAEMMIVEAYAALLLAFLSTESMKVREAISNCLPNNNLKVLVPVLERFVAFHLSLNMISPETHSTVAKVIESCKGA